MKPAVPPAKYAVLLIALFVAACGGGGSDAEPEASGAMSITSSAGATVPSSSSTAPVETAAAPQASEAELRPTGPSMAYPGPNGSSDQIKAWNAQCQTARCMIQER